jgi:hypothetical protein
VQDRPVAGRAGVSAGSAIAAGRNPAAALGGFDGKQGG